MRENPALREQSIHISVGVPPYARGSIRFRRGIRQTAFHPHIGARAKLLKVHNTFLKPYYVENLLDEYWGMRNAAALFDVTGEEATEITGPKALAVMNELVTRDLTRVKDGECLYAIMCYDYGGIVEDAVLIRFNAQKFWWVGGLGNAEQWIYSNSIDRNVTVESRLDRTHIASIQGPKSREILQNVSDGDVASLPFYHMLEAKVCGVPAVITRTGYTAELGYEVYVDFDKGEAMFSGLWEECKAAGGTLGGSGIMDLRRVEAGLIDFSTDFDWHHTPYQVGLGWMLNMKKGFFHGREALSRPEAKDPASRLAGLALDSKHEAFKGDRVLLDGKSVGEITSAVLSPTLGKSIAIAMLEKGVAEIGRALHVETGGMLTAARVAPMPFLDPQRELSKV
jgi:aminomethyltransferase